MNSHVSQATALRFTTCVTGSPNVRTEVMKIPQHVHVNHKFDLLAISRTFYSKIIPSATTPRPIAVRATYAIPQTEKTTFPRPSNIDQWGREGERYSANGIQPTAFQHRNPAVQVPPYDPR
jgi:hypothetical protein